MSIVWPPDLPQSQTITGYVETWLDQFIDSQMDSGPPKRRRVFSGEMLEITSKILMTQAQLATFRDFFNNTLEGGSQPFEWTLPSTGDTVNMLFMSGLSHEAVSDVLFNVNFHVRVDP